MAKSCKSPVKIEDLQGFKILEKFQKILEHTNSEAIPNATELDPRRKLSQNDYFSLFLFTYVNPVLKSMRGLCAATHLEKIHQTVCSAPVSPGSFSEAQSVFEPQLLLSVIQSLATQFQPEFGEISAKNWSPLMELLFGRFPAWLGLYGRMMTTEAQSYTCIIPC
jgi:hypothetical protein